MSTWEINPTIELRYITEDRHGAPLRNSAGEQNGVLITVVIRKPKEPQ